MQPLVFVNQDGGDDAKKLIRSMAMVHYRRKQREGKLKQKSARVQSSGDKSLADGSGRTIVRNSASTNSQPLILKFPLKEKKAANKSRSICPAPIAQGTSSSLPLSYMPTFLYDIPRDIGCAYDEYMIANLWQDFYGDAGLETRDHLPTWERTLKTQLLLLAGKFTPIGGSPDSVDRLNAETLLMIGTKLHDYARHLEGTWLMLNGQSRPCTIKSKFEAKACSKGNLMAAWIMANTHMSAYRSEPVEDYPYHQAILLRDLHDSLAIIGDDKETGCNVEGCISVLCLIEIIRGSNKANVHLKGLTNVVELLGGIDDLRLPGTRPFFELLDLLNAAISSSPLRFTEVDHPILHCGWAPYHEGNYFTSSPLLVREDFKDIPTHRCDFGTHEIQQILQGAFGGMEALQYYDRSAPHTPSPSVGMVQWHLLIKSIETSSHLNNTTANTTRACRLAARIHTRAVTLLMPHSDPINEADTQTLYRILCRTDISAWRGLPYIYLWVLLTASAAARSKPIQRRFFSSEICRCAKVFGVCRDFEQSLKNFIWMQNMLKHEEDSNRASLTLVSDAVERHEIGHGTLLETSYAYEPGSHMENSW